MSGDRTGQNYVHCRSSESSAEQSRRIDPGNMMEGLPQRRPVEKGWPLEFMTCGVEVMDVAHFSIESAEKWTNIIVGR